MMKVSEPNQESEHSCGC